MKEGQLDRRRVGCQRAVTLADADDQVREGLMNVEGHLGDGLGVSQCKRPQTWRGLLAIEIQLQFFSNWGHFLRLRPAVRQGTHSAPDFRRTHESSTSKLAFLT